MYKRPKKQAVQLTSLLDLLFVMIFVSLIQQKEFENVPKEKPVAKKQEQVKKTASPTKETVKEKVVEKKPVQSSFGLRATFHFYSTPQNPSLPEGRYLMQGSYSTKTGELQLGGVRWLDRPRHYDMVPLSGKINKEQDVFRGRVEFQGCEEFSLKRKTKLAGTPISGKWEGVYRCTQGPTGLSLYIE